MAVDGGAPNDPFSSQPPAGQAQDGEDMDMCQQVLAKASGNLTERVKLILIKPKILLQIATRIQGHHFHHREGVLLLLLLLLAKRPLSDKG